jgi:hypothetical protein
VKPPPGRRRRVRRRSPVSLLPHGQAMGARRTTVRMSTRYEESRRVLSKPSRCQEPSQSNDASVSTRLQKLGGSILLPALILCPVLSDAVRRSAEVDASRYPPGGYISIMPQEIQKSTLCAIDFKCKFFVLPIDSDIEPGYNSSIPHGGTEL